MENKKVTALLVLLVGILLVTPVTGVMLRDNSQETSQDTLEDPTYLQIPLEDQGVLETLRQKEVNIVDSSGWAAIVKVSDYQVSVLENTDNIETIEIKDRTNLEFTTAGVSFDTTEGPQLEDEWTTSDSDHHVVQFIAPARADWEEEVKNTAGEIERHVGNNGVVVELTEDEKQELQDKEIVEWIGTYQPGYKVEENLKKAEGGVGIRIKTHSVEKVSEVKNKLIKLGANNIEVIDHLKDLKYITADIEAYKIPDVASMDSVKQIMEHHDYTYYNNVGNRVVEATEAWNMSRNNLGYKVTGDGVNIHIQDSGIDADHPDFNQGPQGNRIVYASVSTDTTDSGGHGTHVTGAAAGNGYNMEGYLGLDNNNRKYHEVAPESANTYDKYDLTGFAGRAPESGIVFYDGLTSDDWQTGHDNHDARIFSNSWGPTSVDNTYDSTADSFILNNKDSSVIFAAGNDGPYAHTVSGAATGKNVIAVGASENFRPDSTSISEDKDKLAGFSSRGPTAGGRIKPDVVEIGEEVYSTKAESIGAEDANVYNQTRFVDHDNDGNADYKTMSGTSMACPHVAGDAGLIRQYLRDEYGYNNLNMRGDLIKALLIYSSEDMGYGYPSYQQGWGRVNIKNVVNPPEPRNYKIFEGTGGYTRTINVRSDQARLKTVMTYLDDDDTSGTLSTDYDVQITSPSGVVYSGNSFQDSWTIPDGTGGVGTMPNGTSYNFDSGGDGGDDMNNVEMLRVKNPEPGTWTIDVTHKEGTAMNATVIAGADLGPTQNYEVGMNYDYEEVPHIMDGYGSNTVKATAGGSVSIPFTLWNNGMNSDTIDLTGAQPSGWNAPSFSPGSSLSMDANSSQHVITHLQVPSGAAEDTYKLRVTGTSSGGSAEDELVFNIDVINTELPVKQKVTDNSEHEDTAVIETFQTGDGTNYEVVAYIQEQDWGPRVMVKVSSDGGDTFSDPMAVSPQGDAPSYLDMMYKPSTERLFVSWYAFEKDGSTTTSTTCAETYMAYADAPYSSWSLSHVFQDGEGPSSDGGGFITGGGGGEYNTYRAIVPTYYPGNGTIIQIVEAFQYDGSDLTSASLTGINTLAKYSEDGGATWSNWGQISPDDGNYYFFPDAYADTNEGKTQVWYYGRDSGSTTSNRNLLVQEFTSTGWTGSTYVMENTVQNQFPQGTYTVDGGGNTIDWAANFKAPSYGAIGNLSIVETSDEGTSYTNHDFNAAPCVDDNDFIDAPVLDITKDDSGYIYAHYPEVRKHNTYENNGLYAIYSNDGFGTANEDWLTKGHYFTSRPDGSGFGSRDNIVYHTQTLDGDYEIHKIDLHPGWQSDSDVWGPETNAQTVTDFNVSAGTTITASANINDFNYGGSTIAAAEYYWDSDPGTGSGTAMNAVDGGWDNMQESVTLGVDTSGLSGGWHTLYIRGQDSANNWGTAEPVDIYIQAESAPTYDTHSLGTMSTGWQYVSFNITADGDNYAQPNDLIEILNDTEYGIQGSYDKVMCYDSSQDRWRSYKPGRNSRFNDLSTWNRTMGIWIHMTASDSLTVEGTAPTDTTINLEAGWNMVGYPSSTITTASNTLPGEVSKVGYYDGTAAYNLAYATDLSTIDLTPGEGYWVYADAATTWTVSY